jgi:hypothetical protein
VEKPIPQFTTSIAGCDEPVTVDLPQSITLHLQQRLALPNGGIAIFSAYEPALLSADKGADRYAIALVRVELQPR